MRKHSGNECNEKKSFGMRKHSLIKAMQTMGGVLNIVISDRSQWGPQIVMTVRGVTLSNQFVSKRKRLVCTLLCACSQIVAQGCCQTKNSYFSELLCLNRKVTQSSLCCENWLVNGLRRNYRNFMNLKTLYPLTQRSSAVHKSLLFLTETTYFQPVFPDKIKLFFHAQEVTNPSLKAK